MPELIERGHLYIAQPPLYKITKGRSERYVKDQAEMDAYLIEEGTSEADLRLANGEVITGADLADRVGTARAVKASVDRLRVRAPGFALEAAALSGALVPEPEAAAIEATAQRLNSFSDEGEDNWAGELNADNNLVFTRDVRGVTETVILNAPLRESPDARRLSERALAIADIYTGPAVFTARSGTVTTYSPTQLVDAVVTAGSKGMKVQRYKGLGEMNPEQLWETTLDPNVRTLLQVSVTHADTADELFTKLMGDVVEPRREFIQEHALEAEVDA
jgi:DNA gyrase subunit B